MAQKATVYKADLDISDMDRHYYVSHHLTLALHPSETESRLMLRVLAFALNAQEALQFTRGLSADDEPDIWLKDLTYGHLEIPVIRRSRESGNPEKSRRWIPAYAGMTGFSSFPYVIEKGGTSLYRTEPLN